MSEPRIVGFSPPYKEGGGRVFEAFVHWNGMAFLAFGVSLWLGGPNLEIHFPGGFLRVGWRVDPAGPLPYMTLLREWRDGR